MKRRRWEHQKSYCRLEYILTDRLPQFRLQLFFTLKYLRHESSFTPIKGNVVNHMKALAIPLNSQKGQIERHRIGQKSISIQTGGDATTPIRSSLRLCRT